MSQSRKHSLAEAVFNNVVSFTIAYAVNLIAIPAFQSSGMTGREMAFWLTLTFSVISIIRQYIIRRFFNRIHVKTSQP